jgi:hypothetical protein
VFLLMYTASAGDLDNSAATWMTFRHITSKLHSVAEWLLLSLWTRAFGSNAVVKSLYVLPHPARSKLTTWLRLGIALFHCGVSGECGRALGEQSVSGSLPARGATV